MRPGQVRAGLDAIGGLENPGQSVEIRNLGPGQRARNGRLDLIRDISHLASVGDEPLAEGRRGVGGGAEGVGVALTGDGSANPGPQRADVAMKSAR